ncbi:MAG: DNA repair protein RecO [Bacilli bacterium]
MLEEVEGIIISERPYGETSKILNIITKKYGIIGLIAKGSKQIKSDLRSVTNKLTYGNFNIYYKKEKLSTLVSVDLINPFKNIKKNLKKISYASFIVDLTEQVYKQNANDNLYDFLINSLVKIDEGFDEEVISNILELKYLDYLGVMPVIDCCSICGRTNSIVTISARLGGYVCKECYQSECLVTEKTIKLIRMYYYVDISKISRLDVSLKSKFEINRFLDDYYDQYTGLYLKSKAFLKDLNKI